MVTLKVATPPQWADVALRDFDAFLLDHAACERKAASVGMMFVVRYPDRTPLLDPLIHFAREELEHFHQVYRLIAARGLRLQPDYRDEYVNLLLKEVRKGRDERLLDRLLICAAIEARGSERLFLVAERLTDVPLKTFYTRLARAEDSHKDLFVNLSLKLFPKELVLPRLDALLDVEAAAIQAVPFRAAVH